MITPIPNSGSLDELGEATLRPVQECDGDRMCSACAAKAKKRRVREKRGGPEIHSAKAHRCVDKVKAKGHDESSAWAICTSSIGKRGVFAKGHGGNANPKKKVSEKGFSNDPPGSGGRFAACRASGKSAALCANIGRRKYGAKRMAQWAARGRSK